MATNFKAYASRLVEYYQEYGDEFSVKRILDLINVYDDLDNLVALRENPRVNEILGTAVSRHNALARRLVSDPNMTDKERGLAFVGMDWAKWYISALGGDVEKLQVQMELDILEDAKRVNLI